MNVANIVLTRSKRREHAWAWAEIKADWAGGNFTSKQPSTVTHPESGKERLQAKCLDRVSWLYIPQPGKSPLLLPCSMRAPNGQVVSLELQCLDCLYVILLMLSITSSKCVVEIEMIALKFLVSITGNSFPRPRKFLYHILYHNMTYSKLVHVTKRV